MRWVLLALCGCNQIFGVHGELVRADAQQFDAPTDAQPYCPAFGTLPAFSPLAHEVIDQECFQYTFSSSGVALANCRRPTTGQLDLVQGPIDSVLDEPATGLDRGDENHAVDGLHISPDGNAAYLESFDLGQTTTTIESYTRTGPTAWTRGPDITQSILAGASSPSRGPEVHMLLFDRTAVDLHEVILTGGAPIPVRTIATTAPPLQVWLSPDGLRAFVLVDSLAPRYVYLERPQLDADFTAHEPYTSLPAVAVFINEDCTRAYLSDVSAVFYVPQI